MNKEEALKDFLLRIKHYQDKYEPLDEFRESNISFLKIYNTGEKVLVHKHEGHIQSRIVYYLMNIHITPRTIYLARVSWFFRWAHKNWVTDFTPGFLLPNHFAARRKYDEFEGPNRWRCRIIASRSAVCKGAFQLHHFAKYSKLTCVDFLVEEDHSNRSWHPCASRTMESFEWDWRCS